MSSTLRRHSRPTRRRAPSYRWLASPHGYVIGPWDWYVRVADLPAFLRRIAPVLEACLAKTGAAGFTGELLLNFYRSGPRLAFAGGHLATVEPWEPVPPLADASFPDLTFLKILFGYRSLEELCSAFPDCYAREARAAALIDVLFAKQPSLVWPVA